MSGIVTSAFQGGTGGRGGWVPSEFCGSCDGCSGLPDVFPIFVIYLNDLPSKVLL